MNKLYNKNLSLDENKLIDSALPYLKSFIENMKGFYPFGMAMGSNGEIMSIASSDGNDNPNSEDLISLLNESISFNIKNNNYIIGMIFIDIYLHKVMNKVNIKENAIEIRIMRNDYIVKVYLIYELNTDNKVHFKKWE